jgi:autotransporter-associated beta strand protein
MDCSKRLLGLMGSRGLWILLIVGMAVGLGAARSAHAGAFLTPGDLVVYQVGNGSLAPSTSGSPVLLDEYSPSGTLVQQIPMPTTASGGNYAYFSTSSATEGYLNLSPNGQFLASVGYSATGASLSGTAGTAVARVVALVTSAGTVNTTTALTNFASGGNPRSAVTTDGNSIWVAGSGTGILGYTTVGSTTATVNISATVTTPRVIGIYNGQLYLSDDSGSGTIPRIGTVGSLLPTTTGQTITDLPGLSESAPAPYAYFFANLGNSGSNPNTLYEADNGADAIEKYSLVGGNRTFSGSVTGVGAVGGLTGTVVNGNVQLFATSVGTLSYAVDTSGYAGTLSGSATSIVTVPGTPDLRGVAFVPEQEQLLWTGSNSGTWDTSTVNWLGVTSSAASAFTGQTGQTGQRRALFADPVPANNVVTISGSIATSTISVTNNSGVYAFSGGTLSGGSNNMPLNKTGSGTLLINATVLNPISVSAGTLGGTGYLGNLWVGPQATLTAGSTTSPGILNLAGTVADFSAGGNWLWKLGSLADNSTGAAGTSFDQLNLNGGLLNWGASSTLTLSFPGNVAPSASNAFWTAPHTWTIASGGTESALLQGYTPVNGTYASGVFSTALDGSGDLLLEYTRPGRNLIWAATAGSGPTDASGTWLNSGTVIMASDNILPATGAVNLSSANNVLLALNGLAETAAGLTGGGSSAFVSLGSGGALSINDAGTTTFAGIITGSGSVAKIGSGTTTWSGNNNFTGSLALNGGVLSVAGDANLGDPSVAISFSNSGGLAATTSFASARNVTLDSAGSILVPSATNTLTLSGQIGGSGPLIINGPGQLVLSNTANSYQGQTLLAGGTLSISSSGNLGGGGDVVFTGAGSNTTLRFTNSMTVSNNIDFPTTGAPFCWLDTQGNTVTLTGQLSVNGSTILFNKTGSGTLVLAAGDTTGLAKGNTYINQGTVAITAVGYQGYSALTSGEIVVYAGGTLQLANVTLGYATDSDNSAFVDLYNTSTLKASGTSAYYPIANGDLTAVLNYNATSKTYSPATVAFQTVNSSDVLAIEDSIHQYDPNDDTNNYGTAVKTGSATYAADASKLVTIHVTGPGAIQLQSGGVSSDETFGGSWSVDQGVLQIGPIPTTTNTPGWSGPTGQILNALGFKTLDGQTYAGAGSIKGDPDMPNGVTVNSGGMFAVAVDQVNQNTAIVNQGIATPQNDTPNYLRNPITLSGGTLAATAFEVSFPDSGGVAATTNPVTARLGGDFTVSPGTSTVDTYDPVGGTGARTVQLLGGTRVLSNSTAAFAAGTVLTYGTTWAGALNVDGGGYGGQFQLLRDSGETVTVLPGANINILNGASVVVGDVDPSAEADNYAAGLTVTPDPNGGLRDSVSGTWVNFSGGSGGGTLVFSRTSADVAYGGNVSGDLSLAQEGSTNLILSGSNSYTEGTVVDSGTLVVDSAAALPDGGSLIVGAGAAALFGSAAPSSSPAGGAVPVPEPGCLTLLFAFAVAGAIGCLPARSRRPSRGGKHPVY